MLRHLLFALLAVAFLIRPTATALAASSAMLGFSGPALHASVQLEPADPHASPPCPAGQVWQAGACVNPCLALSSVYQYYPELDFCYLAEDRDREHQNRACISPAGYYGDQTRSRYRIRFFGKTLTNPGPLTVVYLPWSEWGDWTSCPPLPEDSPDRPGVGSQITLKALICGPSDLGYHTVVGADWAKQQVIAKYRGFGASRRCPEAGGFQYWMTEWRRLANQAVGTDGDDPNAGLHAAWPTIEGHMFDRALSLRELDPPAGDSGIPAANALCRDAARERWPGFSGQVEYRVGSGNLCLVTAIS
ncbi:MAG: hypothetical protein M0R28_12345 [Pigmentiphaga sp.]|nr:hypothetical protein [Pigmentiphaga sp.]